MSRILWFSLGALAGAAYASRVINTERLDLAVGESRPAEQAKNAVAGYKAQIQGYKQQLADMVEQQASRMGEMVTGKGHVMAESIRSISFMEESKTDEIAEARTATAAQVSMPTTVGGRIGDLPL